MDADLATRLAAFDQRLLDFHIWGQWKSEALLSNAIGGPRPAGLPTIWKWDDIQALHDEACTVLTEPNESRRSLMFHNPALARGATHTINMGVQRIEPGEVALPHRHSIAALRFVIQGDPGLTTVVNDEPCPMCDFDLILTPNWSRHEHRNNSNRSGYWLDVLDVPLVISLNQTFFAPTDDAPYAREKSSPGPYRFPWHDMGPRLNALANTAPDLLDGHAIEYLGPSGASVMPTLSCWIQRLQPGWTSRPRRRTSSAIFFVVRGSGKTVVGDTELRWGKRDCFVVPAWSWFQHANPSSSDDAVLFSVHDIPVIKALGFYRDESLPP